jgi:dolichol-phosphate mannosyltransferase
VTKNFSTGFSIIIFGYNEGGTLFSTTEKALGVLGQLTDMGELIIVDDGSTDDSKSVLQKIKKDYPQVIIHRFEHNRGIGTALKTGYRLATKSYVCAIPADGQFDVAELLLAPMPSEKEIISFSRQVNKIYKRGRKVLSLLNRLVNRYIFGLMMTDVNWIKIYPTRVLQQIPLECDTSILETEICAKLKLLGMHFYEVPSHYHPRVAGESKSVTPVSVFKVFLELGKLYATVHRFKKEISTAPKFRPEPAAIRANAGIEIHG